MKALTEFPMFRYDLIVADPPWAFESWTDDGGNAKGAKGQYDVMPLHEIKALPVGDLAGGDCLLLLWTCGWAMATGQAQEVARAWGFNPITELVWRKVTASGKPRMGTGYRARSLHEPILLCTTGNPKHRPLLSEFPGVARKHSQKPEEFYRMVERRCPRLLNRLDLFSRQTRPGWDGWGKEFGKFDAELTDGAESDHDTVGRDGARLKPQEMSLADSIPAAASPGGLFSGSQNDQRLLT